MVPKFAIAIVTLALMLGTILSFGSAINAMPIEDDPPLPRWIAAANMNNYISVRDRNWETANIVNIGITTTVPKWITTNVVTSILYANATSNTTTWEIIHITDNIIDTETSWEIVHDVSINGHTNTEWIVSHIIEVQISNEFEFIFAHDIENIFNGKERQDLYIIDPFGQGDDSIAWMMLVLYLIIIWLPALLLGFVAPGYGTMIGVVLMGIVMVMMYPSFIIVTFMMIVSAAVVFYRSGN
jgi:hypothetical protein